VVQRVRRKAWVRRRLDLYVRGQVTPSTSNLLVNDTSIKRYLGRYRLQDAQYIPLDAMRHSPLEAGKTQLLLSGL